MFFAAICFQGVLGQCSQLHLRCFQKRKRLVQAHLLDFVEEISSSAFGSA